MAKDQFYKPNEKRAEVAISSHKSSVWNFPRRTAEVIQRVLTRDRHPLIQLDRLSIPLNQETQKKELALVVETTGDAQLLDEVFGRRRQALIHCTNKPVQEWRQKTAEPLTLHLARANVLENAGLAMHPIYGFAYLPASGLKGMARAAAKTLLGWDNERIDTIFGNEPGAGELEQLVGHVCFHDAWPIKWPQLFVDIVNSHHPQYYSGKESPGEWESPTPVYLLAVQPKTEFHFVLAGRRKDTSKSYLDDAMHCLQAALYHLGAGAKTAAGFGAFEPAAEQSMLGSSKSQSYVGPSALSWTLRLETPAFLAGSKQQEHDCSLRVSTLRGVLRTWWRTMHAGFVSVNELRAIEASIWGDTHQGSPIRLRLRSSKSNTPELHVHPQGRSGIRYLAYGMHDGGKQRFRLTEGAEWMLVASVVPSSKMDGDKKTIPIPAELIAEQLQCALWLLGQYGGVGGKSRKGFGSMSIGGTLRIRSLEDIEKAANRFRGFLNLSNEFLVKQLESLALGHPETIRGEMVVGAEDALGSIEKIGRAYSEVAASYKHRDIKAGLGLPRKIHGPHEKAMPHQSKHEEPVFLDTARRKQRKVTDARYASPIHLHVEKQSQGKWIVRWIAMPAVDLPTLDKNAAFLKEFIGKFQPQLSAIAKSATPQLPTQSSKAPIASQRVFEQVVVEILEVKPAGNRVNFRVQEVGKKPGMLQFGTPPSDLPKVSDRVTVYRPTKYDQNSPLYYWNEPVAQTPNKPRGGRR